MGAKWKQKLNRIEGKQWTLCFILFISCNASFYFSISPHLPFPSDCDNPIERWIPKIHSNVVIAQSARWIMSSKCHLHLIPFIELMGWTQNDKKFSLRRYRRSIFNIMWTDDLWHVCTYVYYDELELFFYLVWDDNGRAHIYAAPMKNAVYGFESDLHTKQMSSSTFF